MDGSNVRTLVADGVRCPTSLRIDLPLRRLYWTEHELNVIDSISVDGTNRRVSKYESRTVFEDKVDQDLVIFQSITGIICRKYHSQI